MQANEPESLESEAGYGPSSRESFASYDPAMSLWKTSQLSFFEELTVYSATWPRAGMMRNGNAYPLRPLVLRTSGTAFSYWPTPTVPNGGRSPKGGMGPTGMTPDGKKRQVDLQLAVRMVERQLWPTPQARDYRTGMPERYKGEQSLNGRRSNLNDAVGGQLNPMWVELLMGFPAGWTEVED